MKIVETSIEIAAPADRIWSVLTDFADYAQWNPFMRSVVGRPKPGERLAVTVAPPGGKPMSFRPVVLDAMPARRLRWRGRLLLPGLFDGEHRFDLTDVPLGTRLDHGEHFSGLLAAVVMGEAALDRTRRGFVAMNEALKSRCEKAT